MSVLNLVKFECVGVILQVVMLIFVFFFFFFQAEDGIRDWSVTGVQTCALPIYKVVCTVIEAPASAHEGQSLILQALSKKRDK